MAGVWKFISEEADTISLHDHCISQAEEDGTDLILRFDDDGFDVTKDNSLNPTGRHRNTGPAAIVLKNWRWGEGSFGPYCFQVIPLDNGRKEYVPLPIVPITRAQFLHELTLEVLNFTWEPEQSLLTLEGDGRITPPPPGSETGFLEIKLFGEQMLFCWDDLPRDAWFQDWPRK